MPKKGKCTVSRKKTGLVGAMGAGFEIIKALIDEIKSIGGKEEDVRRILAEKDIRGKAAKLLVGKPEWVWTNFVVIDHALSLPERVENGHYGMIVREFLELYPGKPPRDGSDRVELALIQFNRPTLYVDVFAEISRLGLHPGGVEELVALGGQHPEVGFKYHVLALADSQVSGSTFFDVPSFSWSVPGGSTLSTWQSTSMVGDGVTILCVKTVRPVAKK